ncbi:MAG TPA: haloacid dehalogenase type II [Candidatus Bathyarchaeia archaeon]|nr:haloacid dehalogenase type II [Candidatus Bathyarchaeia archaeon]
MGAKVSAITFDVYSAIFDLHTSLVPQVDRCLKEVRSSVSPVEFFRNWRETQLRYAQISTNLCKEHFKFIDLTRYSLSYACRKFEVNLDDNARLKLVDAWSHLEPYSDVEPVLNHLKDAGFRIAMLSNGDMDMLQTLSSRLSVKFDAIYSADTVAVYKPHPKIYHQPVKAWNLQPPQIMHVAGSPTDAIGAKASNLTSVWVNRIGIMGEELPFKPDYEIRTLTDLTTIL